ncbi:MAG: DUF2971 domain-containing protein [Bacilli bacterium]|nr:DUF2971 domain-containing protein [Bacilli bacterium]
MIIYKYLNENGALKTIKNGCVLLRHPIEYNDPLDSIVYCSQKIHDNTFKLIKNYALFTHLKSLFDNNVKDPITRIPGLKMQINSIDKSIKKDGLYTYMPSIEFFIKQKKEPLRSFIESNKKNYKKQIDKVFKDIKHKVLISCFSLDPYNFLMWSHYADKHKGVCLEYEIDDNDKVFKKVKYYKQIPDFDLYKYEELDLARAYNNASNEIFSKIEDVLYKPFISKGLCWKYEKEIRIIVSDDERMKSLYSDNKGNYFYKMPKIKRIFVGCEASESLINELKEVAGDIPFTKMKLKNGEYDLERFD